MLPRPARDVRGEHPPLRIAVIVERQSVAAPNDDVVAGETIEWSNPQGNEAARGIRAEVCTSQNVTGTGREEYAIRQRPLNGWIALGAWCAPAIHRPLTTPREGRSSSTTGGAVMIGHRRIWGAQSCAIQDVAGGVDFSGVATRTTFAEVLDAALGADDEDLTDARACWSCATVPFIVIESETSARQPTVTPRIPFTVAHPHAQQSAGFRSPLARHSSGRPLRQLAPRQQAALDAIVLLGAHLGTDFTLPELRSAYRVLARTFHPDRHVAASEQEKSRLAAVFTALADNYRCLLEAFGS